MSDTKQLRNARTNYRNQAKAVVGDPDDDQANQPNQAASGGRGSGSPPSDPPGAAALPPPGDDDDSQRPFNVPPNSQPSVTSDDADEQEGLEEMDKWKSALESGVDSVLSFTGGVGKAAMTVMGLVQGLYLFNTGILAANRSLEQYNGQIANAYARADAEDIDRDIRKGAQLAGPLTKLAEEQSELKDSVAEYSVPLQYLLLQLLQTTTWGVNGLFKIVEHMPGLTGIAARILKAMPNGDQELSGDWRSFLEDVSDGKFDGVRPTFDGNGNANGQQQILPDAAHQQVFGP